MPIDVDTLKTERDKLKKTLRQLEIEQRKTESELRTLRQQELKVKRQIDALGTLVELYETQPGPEHEPPQ